MTPNKQMIVAAVAAALLAVAAPEAFAQSSPPEPAKAAAAKARAFATPEEAAEALAAAVRGAKREELLAIVGPGSSSWLFSGDNVADKNDWSRFLAAYEKKHNVEKSGDKATLNVGDDAWPFPAPIVSHAGRWSFDANAGREEILNRRVGRNELDTIQALLAAVDAQREYAAGDLDGNGYSDYARKFRSSPGKKDGLYWPDQAGKPQSPLGPLVATASKEGYGKQNAAASSQPAPFRGYYYRILTSQGKDAAGGAYDYLVGDKLIGGFAIVAWPASYRVSGVTTFVVNHDGVVYEKDLGPQTASIAQGMSRYNPDATWKKAE
jgi:hypothetical protein